MMNCHISLQLENEALRSVWVRQGQTVQVGRNEWADFKVPEDQMMSRLHFAIESGSEFCVLRDLGSRNGTFVNGAPVNSVQLSDGDQILAGQSRFQVVLDNSSPHGVIQQPSETPGEHPESTRSPSHPRPAPKPVSSGDSVASIIQAIRETGKLGSETILLDELERRASNYDDGDDKTMVMDGFEFLESSFSYDAFSSPNGEVHYYSSHDRARPLELARILASRPGFYLILNTRTLNPETHAVISNPSSDRQFTRLTNDLMLISQEGSVDRRLEIFSQNWGRDTMVGIVSRLADEHLVERIRLCAQEFMLPSRMLQSIRSATPDQLLRSMADLDAILLEDDSYEKWAVVLNPLVNSNWESLGFPGPPERIVKSGTETN
jgi:pSer/pThr/pTyr-binding forkhead associated (FHA) protein